LFILVDNKLNQANTAKRGEKGSKQAKRRETEPTGQNRPAMWHGHTVPTGTVGPLVSSSDSSRPALSSI